MNKFLFTRHTFLFASYLLFILPSFYAQENRVMIKWGNKYPVSKFWSFSSFIGVDSSGIILNKYNGFSRNEKLERYDLSMNKVKTEDIKLEKDYPVLGGMFYTLLLNELYIIYLTKDPRVKKYFLLIEKRDKKTLKHEEDIKVLAEFSYKNGSNYQPSLFAIRLSRDKKRLLIYYQKPQKKIDKDDFYLIVLNENTDVLWEREISLDYDKELFKVKEFRVDNFGNVHLVGDVHKKPNTWQPNQDLDKKYRVISYLNNGKDRNEYVFKKEKIKVKNVQISVNKKEEIICSGFFENKEDKEQKGVFFIKIDLQKSNTILEKFHLFEEESEMKYSYNRKVSRLLKFTAKEIILKKDGGALLVGEEDYNDIQSNGNGTYILKNNNELAVINFTAEGEISWARKIDKLQSSTQEHSLFTSYYLLPIKDKLLFFFNDHIKNQSINKYVHRFKKIKRSMLVMVEMDKYGNQSKKVLFKYKDVGLIAQPIRALVKNYEELIIFCQKSTGFGFRKNKASFIHLSFDLFSH